MTWLTGKTYQFSFSLFPKIFGIKDGWIIKYFFKTQETVNEPVFEQKLSEIKPYKTLIQEKISKNKLKVLHSNLINIGDVVKIDKDVPPEEEFLLYYEVIDIDNNIITLNRPVIQDINLLFLEHSNLTGIYYFNFTPKEAGLYLFEISNPKHLIKPFGTTIEVKDKFFIQELIETYTDELNKKFNVKSYDPDPTKEIEGVHDPIWFNKETGKVWVWSGSKWVTADE